MSGFNDFSGSAAAGGRSVNKEDIMDQVRGQMAIANAQELLQKMTDKCYAKCIPKPGADLSSSERVCLAKCMDRYLEAWNVVSKAYATRLQRDMQRGGQ